MKRKLKLLKKYLVNTMINPTFSWCPDEGLYSLMIKMNIYFFLHKRLGNKYKTELQFIRKKTKQSLKHIYSWIFPYPFINTLSIKSIQVYTDASKGLFFVVHEGKRLYFKRELDTEEKVRNAYYCVSIEQHKESPHCYLNEQYNIDGGIALDVGSAEGLLGLMLIEKIDKLYLFEVEEGWIEALQATFEPWKDKVIIINKYVSDKNDTDCVTLDTIIKDEVIELIKIDVEGTEQKILAGAANTLNKTKKVCVCTYHKNNDEVVLKNYLDERGWITSFSNNSILYILSKLYPPYFRKCLIRAKKNETSMYLIHPRK